MKRQLYAVALATACSAMAQAQTSVTMYGVIDVAGYRKQLAGEPATGQVANGGLTTSFLGFRGSEDLGGGLSANFELTSWFNADTGAASRSAADTFFSRSSWVGLQSENVGALKLGRLWTWGFVNTARYSAFGASSGFGPSMLHNYLPSATQPMMTGSGSVGTGDTVWSNSIGYETPVFAGLQAALMLAPSEGTTAGRRTGAMVNYQNGPLSGGLVYQAMDGMSLNFSKPPANVLMAKSRLVNAGASYDFGVLKLFGQAIRTRLDNPGTRITLTTTQLSTAVPVGVGRLLAAWANTRQDETAASGQKRDTVSVGYDHPLSKRTDLYGVVMRDKVTNLSSGTGYAVGIRHAF